MDFERKEKDKFIVPIGPQHPALKEPGHFEFTVDGEIVTGATIRLGFVHRGIEKLAESRTYIQNLYMMERVCGICSHVHGTAFTLGVEKLAGLTVPPRAQAIRTLVGELERVHSHLLWLGVAAHEGGFDTLFMYSWRDRETVMNILENISGNRVHYSANVIGGVKFDISDAQKTEILKGIDFLDERTHYYMKVIMEDETFRGRTVGVGTMTHEQADTLGAVGPTARASGVVRDVRADSPYASYPDFPIEVKTHTAGDLHARFIVRIEELYEAYRLIRLILEKMPTGDLAVRAPRRIPAGETISRVEAPRGELMYYIKSNGTDMPERVKARTPSLCNWGTISSVAVGHKLADMPMLLVGIDPCFSCNDRLINIKQAGSTQELSWDDLRIYGIEYYRR
ncbi:MAG: NADH dehydrogenase subunit [Anaerolineaceae bacterium]|nr:NADH dehydrogenase subunit [Anaerolineaceae bacterium]NTV37173.1 NADH dehydrogenase subunit [Anaerolineaceae bacterium]